MTTPNPVDIAQNGLLSVLVDEDRERLRPHMLMLEMEAGAILHRAGDDVVDTWFPLAATSAAFCVEDVNGEAMDVALIGREGAIGGIVSNGHVPAYSTAVVRFPGRLIRIKTSALEQVKGHSLPLRHWFSRYSDCLLAQVFQTAVCNAKHTIRQRVAKMMLASLARTGEHDLHVTQEELADMLGVGRSFVTRVLGNLREEGIVEQRRGVLRIRDEHRLRRVSCGCTLLIENHFDKVLHGIYPPA